MRAAVRRRGAARTTHLALHLPGTPNCNEELAPSLLSRSRGRGWPPSGRRSTRRSRHDSGDESVSPIERQDSRCAEALPSDEDLSLDGMELNTDGSAALADQIGDLHIELDESWLTRSPPRKKHARTSFGPPGSPVEGGRGSRGSRGRPTSVVCEPSTSLSPVRSAGADSAQEGEEGRECGGGALEGAMRCDPPAVVPRSSSGFLHRPKPTRAGLASSVGARRRSWGGPPSPSTSPPPSAPSPRAPSGPRSPPPASASRASPASPGPR
eukprot:tig00001073_g6824.t1